MPEEPTTEFIPKRPLAEERPEMPKKRGGLLRLLAFVIFVASILAAGGVFLFRSSLESQVEQKSSQIQIARGEFEPELLEEMAELDRRIITTGEVLSNHITISPLFETLEAITLPTVRYSEFTYTLAEDGSVQIEMAGEAEGFTDIALQSGLFDDNKYIKNQLFSNLDLDEETGNVVFDLSFSVDRNLLLYGRST